MVFLFEKNTLHLEYADAWDKNDNGIPDYAEDDR